MVKRREQIGKLGGGGGRREEGSSVLKPLPRDCSSQLPASRTERVSIQHMQYGACVKTLAKENEIETEIEAPSRQPAS